MQGCAARRRLRLRIRPRGSRVRSRRGLPPAPLATLRAAAPVVGAVCFDP